MFVQVGVAVQYRVLVNGAYDAYYRLTDPRNQIQSYVFDVVRSTVPRMDLDEAFVSKDEVGGAVLAQLRDVMKDYGYEINKTLVTDLSPDNRVKASMNEINASRRLKEGKLDSFGVAFHSFHPASLQTQSSFSHSQTVVHFPYSLSQIFSFKPQGRS